MAQKIARRIYKRIWFWTVVVIAVLAVVCIVYLNDYYRADAEAIAAFGDVAPAQVLADGTMTFGAADSETGLIFYPGGKVEHRAYAPLMSLCAERGVFCVLVKMPFHLAVLDADAGAEIPAKFPDVGRWYLSGHSLGGSMAASSGWTEIAVFCP